MEQSYPRASTLSPDLINARVGFSLLLGVVALCLVMWIGLRYHNLAHDAPLLVESTLGELAQWMSDQSGEESPPSLLARWAKQWADAESAELDDVTNLMQSLFLTWCIVTALFISAGVFGVMSGAKWTHRTLIGALVGVDILLFLVPTVENDGTLILVLITILTLLILMLFAPGKITRVIGFFIAVSVLLVVWEGTKLFAASVNYAITAPNSQWEYTTYPSIEDSLNALSNDDVDLVLADRNTLEELMPVYGADAPETELPFPELRYVDRLPRTESVLIFPIGPELPGRLSIAVRADEAATYDRISKLADGEIGAIEGDFAVERFLSVPRRTTLLNLKILNDLNLPHLESIAGAFLQPARRNGEFLLMRILGDAALFTLREAVLGFGFGVVLGLFLGTVFAHSKLMERAFLPYVVASQTVPILAIAPMVVIWLGASYTSVAVIAAYITFFPVAINTLRGLQSPTPTQIELMQSFAASRWEILWKLRFPSALPFIFTALKVSATASVVGAIIGELPSGISGGLGRAILDFSSDYSLISTPKLWATIVTAALAGVLFFVIISIAEQIVLSRYARSKS